MVAVRITGFAGVVPRLYRRALDPRQAQVAVNSVLTSGSLSATNRPKAVTATLVSAPLSIFRMESGSAECWLSWDRDVDVARGPIAGDESQRIYYTGDGEPRVTDYALASSGGGPYPTDFYVLGVFPPATAPGASHSGGTGTAVNRTFCYTFVTAWGEESMPSPASAVATGKTDGTWTVNTMDVAPANSFTATGVTWAGGFATFTGISSTFGLRVGEEVDISGFTPAGYNVTRTEITALTGTTVEVAIAADPGAYSAGGTLDRTAPHNTTGMTKRIYWSETTAAGTLYYFVKEIAVATTSTTVDGDTVAGEVLPSAEWAQPPVDMHSIGVLPNGIMYGASKNNVCLSEPNKPYAWPERHRQTCDFPIVGMGSFATTIVAATTGTPYTVSGVDPVTMGGGMSKIDQEWPCVAKRSVVTLGIGVAFAVPQGLALIGIGGADIVSRNLYTQREWVDISPESLIAAAKDGRYYGACTPTPRQPELLIIDKAEFASLYNAQYTIDEAWTDPLTGKLYVLIDCAINEWEGDIGQRDTYDWMSREFVIPTPVNLGAAKVDADFTMTEAEQAEALVAYNALLPINQALIDNAETYGAVSEMEIGVLPIAGDTMLDLPPLSFEYLQFNLYVNNQLKFTKPLTDSRAFTLPAGYKSDNFAIRLAGNVKVNAVVLAETMQGLKQA